MNTSISSRTPEGEPVKCPICKAQVRLEFTDKGDAVCPACGRSMTFCGTSKSGFLVEVERTSELQRVGVKHL